MSKSKRFLPVSCITVISLSLYLTACDNNKKQSDAAAQTSQKQTVNVQVITLKEAPFTVKTQLPGRVAAYRTAEIRPQVNGTILKREFKESSDVKAGQSLYQIDPAIYDATYKSASADLSSAKANANVARLTANRYATLLKDKSVSKQDYDKASASAAQADAQVKIAEAAVNTAKVNLEYTKTYSPIDGYIGKSSVTEGALVTAGQITPLAIVQQLDPVYIYITQSVEDYAKFNNNLANNVMKKTTNQTQVELVLNDGSLYPEKGYIEFSEMSVSPTTGTMVLRAVFSNPKRMLLPGMFVKPYIVEGVIPKAILIPQKAVIRENSGKTFVKLVKEDNEIIDKEIVVDRTVGSDWLVTTGVNNNDRVVSSGLMAFTTIRPGTPVYANIVEPKPNEDQSNPASPSTK